MFFIAMKSTTMFRYSAVVKLVFFVSWCALTCCTFVDNGRIVDIRCKRLRSLCFENFLVFDLSLLLVLSCSSSRKRLGCQVCRILWILVGIEILRIYPGLLFYIISGSFGVLCLCLFLLLVYRLLLLLLAMLLLMMIHIGITDLSLAIIIGLLSANISMSSVCFSIVVF